MLRCVTVDGGPSELERKARGMSCSSSGEGSRARKVWCWLDVDAGAP